MEASKPSRSGFGASFKDLEKLSGNFRILLGELVKNFIEYKKN